MVREALTRPKRPLVRALADPRIGPLPDSWADALGRALDSSDRGVRREAVATLKTRDTVRFDRRLLAMGLQADLPAELRVAALDAVAGRQPLPAEAVAFLGDRLSAPAGPVERVTAARALGATRLGREPLLQLAGRLAKVEPTEGSLLLPAFTRSRDAAVGLALVEGLKDAPALGVMTAADLDRVLTSYPDRVLAAARPLADRLAQRLKGRRDELARLASGLPPGNATRGRAVFFSEKATCSSCHRAAGAGGSVGPNLSKVGFIRGPTELLASIVLPAGSITPEFRSYLVTTTRGRVDTGLWAGESAGAIFLRGADPAAVRIPRAEVETLRLSNLSLMPEGFEKLLSRQELSDLVAFLARQR
jgi:putative heme-binding domain-containing protein